MYRLLNYRFITHFSILSRNFRTDRIDFIPRGVISSDRYRRGEQEDGSRYTPNQIQSTPLDATSRHGEKESLKDTRPIDSVDPVILKYVNIMKDTGGISNEKIHLTNFGSIRFDSDNIATIHGQFDATEGHDQAALIDDAIMNTKNIELNQLSANEKIQNVARPTPSHLTSEESTPLISNIETTSNVSQLTGETKDQKPKSEAEKAFEELFGKDDEDVKIFGSDKDLVNYNAKQRKSSEESNSFIDEHFFSADNDLHGQSNWKSSSSSQTPNKSHNSQIQDLGNTKDLNFIDETYFKSSLDTINENRKPTVEFSEIEQDLRKTFRPNIEEESEEICENNNTSPDIALENIAEMDQTSKIALQYLGLDPKDLPYKVLNEKKVKEKPIPKIDPASKNAYEYVIEKRKEDHNAKFGLHDKSQLPNTSRGKKILSLVREKSKDVYTNYEMLNVLKKSIIYDNHDIVGLFKPYGVAMHEGGASSHHVLTKYLPDLAEHLEAEEIHYIHRLDATTTGVLLLARTKTMAKTLREMLKAQEIKKTYWAITKGIPSPLEGRIDIAIADGTINGKHRMVLRPDFDGFRGSPDKMNVAITDFRVLSSKYGTSLVEIKPNTGVKHQVRVHLGFGLGCPVLGDHKYSHLKKLAPQRLPGDALERFNIPQSKVRNLPMFLHSRSVLIPEIANGSNVFIRAKLPAFFNKALKALKLNSRSNMIRNFDKQNINNFDKQNIDNLDINEN